MANWSYYPIRQLGWLPENQVWILADRPRVLGASVDPVQMGNGIVVCRRPGNGDEPLTPVATLLSRGLPDDTRAEVAALFEGKSWEAADDGLYLIMIRRLAGGDRQQGGQC